MSHPPLGIDPNRDALDPYTTPLTDYSRLNLEIWAKCICGSERYIPTSTVMKLLGDTSWMEERNQGRLRAALRCSQCGEKGKADVSVRRRG